MEVLYFLKVLYRKKWIILGLSLLAAVLTLLLIVRKQPLYVSTAQYSTGFTTERLRLADGSSAIDIYTIEVKFDNVIATITSPQVINYVGYTLMLHDLSDTANAYTKLSQNAKESPFYRAIQPDTAKRILVAKLAKNEFLKSDIQTERILIEYFKLSTISVCGWIYLNHRKYFWKFSRKGDRWICQSCWIQSCFCWIFSKIRYSLHWYPSCFKSV